jgi:hypothetical protein
MSYDVKEPEIDQHVKCLLTNNTLVEGYVIVWELQRVVLKSLDGESLLIVHHPERDIMMTKIILNSEPEEEFPVFTPESKEITELENKWEETLAGPSDDELRTKKLAELKVLMIEQEKKIIRDKVRSHSHESSSAYSPHPVKYQSPDLTKIGRRKK